MTTVDAASDGVEQSRELLEQQDGEVAAVARRRSCRLLSDETFGRIYAGT
jgi:hypothetical protein